ncbi:hypothetical protein ACROYT_G042879 [Oculina patagonica]
MSRSLTDEDVKKWYDIAKIWGRGNSAEECRDMFECLQDLSSFLKKLENDLGKVVGNPQLILQKFPSVGKLLGQLYENTVILMSDEVFPCIVRCSLMLTNCSGVQERSVNRKAKVWAQTQLRRATTPVLKHSNLHHFGEFWGYTAQESTEMMVDKLVWSLCHDLEVIRSFTWNAEERECYPQKLVSGRCLRELSEFCLPLLTVTQAKPLVEKILCCQKSFDLMSRCNEVGFVVCESVSQVFLKAVSSSKDLLLSYDARVSLWKRHQPSFESEILDFIEISAIQRPYISRKQLKGVISLSEVLCACAENPEFFAVAFAILSSFLAQSDGNTQVAKLMSVLSEMCVEECKEGQVLATFPEFFPDCCRSLVRKLALNPHDLGDEESILCNLRSIDMELELLTNKLTKSKLFAVWKTLWCFPSWESVVLRLSLSSCGEEVLDGCINMLCWFHVPPLSDKHISLKAALKEILHPLRLLKSKSRLQFADVQYILFTSPVLRASEAAILLGRLLLVFLCNALGGHLVFRDLTPGFSALMRLSFVLDGLEDNILEKKSTSASSTEQKKAWLLSIKEISELLDHARRQLAEAPLSNLAVTTEPKIISNSDTPIKDLLTRTEELINALQAEDKLGDNS